MTVITTQLASINISFDREKKCNMRCVSQHTHYEYKFLFKMSLSVSKAKSKGNIAEKLKIERKQVIILETVEPISNKISVTIMVMLFFFRIFNFFCYRLTDLKIS